MPCDSIRTVSVDLSAMGRIDPKLLQEALKDLGLITALQNDGSLIGQGVSYRSGSLELSGYTASRITMNQVKQAYGRQVVISQCKRYGWAYKETEKGQFIVTKR